MKKREVFTIVLAVLLALASFVGCNSEVDDGMNVPTTVSFVPTAKKSLNQQGSSTEFAKDVSAYHWKYYCSETSPASDAANGYNSLEWTDFDSDPKTTGLGQIKGLVKGNSYYFGLRGYTTSTDTTGSDLIWEGFCGGTTPVTTRLMSKTQYITIDVYAKGKGYLYYDIFAPYDSTDVTTTTSYLPEGITHVRFVSTFLNLSDATTGTDELAVASRTENNGEEVWQYTNTDAQREMATGVYLFTVQEQYWDAEMGQWFDKNDRRQILIVNIASGVDTVIAGSLDSTSSEQFDYYAKDGITVKFNQATSTVAPLTATVYDKTSPTDVIVTATSGFHTVNVLDGSFVRIDWTSKSDTKFYINGEEIQTTGTNVYRTNTDGYYYLSDGTVSKIKMSTNTDVPGLLCEGYYLNDYIVSIVKEGKDGAKDESVSFTIKGYNSENFVTFESDKPFKIVLNGEKKWTGTLEYSTDKDHWTTITNTGESNPLSSGEKNDVYFIYIRGLDNQVITGNGVNNKWTITPTAGYTVACYGNIENMLDYKEVAAGKHPKMDPNSFAYMFYECSALSSAPYLMAEGLSQRCYKKMFTSCTNLKDAPELPAKTLDTGCYESMFENCTKLKSVKFRFTSAIATGDYGQINNWLNNVKATGRYVCDSSVNTDAKKTEFAIPSGWTSSSWT